jgi:hypothetical protein
MGSNFGDLNLQCRDLLELALREIDRSEKALLQIVMFAMFQKAVFSVLYDMVRAKIKSSETKLTLHTCSKHGSRELKTYPLRSLRSDRL